MDDDWHVSGLTVGQVAARTGIAASAVRWYDDHGLLPSERTAGNQRRFFPDVLCRVAMIRAAQKVGLSIEEINDALSTLTPRQAPTAEDWELLAQRLREVVGQRIEEFFALLTALDPGASAGLPGSGLNPSAATRDPGAAAAGPVVS